MENVKEIEVHDMNEVCDIDDMIFANEPYCVSEK